MADDISRPIEATGDPRLDGILSNFTWRTSKFKFVFPEAPFKKQASVNGFKPLSENQRQIVRAVFEEISKFTLLTFEETKDADAADLFFARAGMESRLGRVNSMVPHAAGGGSAESAPGQTWISERHSALEDQRPDGEAFHFWRHETGHILGLEHPHNNFAQYPAPIEYDHVSMTLMSYRLAKYHPQYGVAKYPYPASYMPLDIFALQHLHGANFSTNSGDTTYKFTPEERILFETIWDGGGVDTLDFSAYSQDGHFDIRPGAFSTPSISQLAYFESGGAAEGSLAMAMLPRADPRALIENITVGSGNNTITLNQADNVVQLGQGRNRLVFFPGGGVDIIHGFDGDDCIDLSNYFSKNYWLKFNPGLVTFDQWPTDFIIVPAGIVPASCPPNEDDSPAYAVSAAKMSSAEIGQLKLEMSNASLRDVHDKYEYLWKAEEYEASVELANLAYDKYKSRQAAYRIGIAYYKGFGVIKDFERALEYLSVPQLTGARYAHYFRGKILSDASFAKHDMAAARVELETALDLGVKDAVKALLDLNDKDASHDTPSDF